MKRLTYILFSVLWSVALTAQTAQPYPMDTIDGKIYYRYTVERSVGLYRISKNFGVSQEEILRANPQLQQQGLRYEEVILIPAGEIEVKVEKKKSTKTPKPDKTQDSQAIIKHAEIKPIRKPMIEHVEEIDTLAAMPMAGETDTLLMVEDSSVIRLATLLPLHAEAIERDKNMDRFYDFYAGMLLAVNEVQAAGQKIELFTYDIGKNTQKVSALVADSSWQKVDAIIGPAYGQQVAIAKEMAQRDSAWMLIPFLPTVAGMEDHPYLLKFNPSPQAVADTMARYLMQYGDSINCVVFESSSSDVIPQGISQLHQALKKYQIPTTTTTLRALLSDSLDGTFVEGKENILIFNTEKYGNIQSVMPHLLKAYGAYRITLYSQYSWQNEKIILPQIYTSVFSETPVVPEEYEHMYAEYFAHPLSSTQPRYDLLGYDQTRHLLQLLQTSSDSIATSVWHGIQSNIQYQPVAEKGGYENQMIHIIRK